jgi:hypothetical protein
VIIVANSEARRKPQLLRERPEDFEAKSMNGAKSEMFGDTS